MIRHIKRNQKFRIPEKIRKLAIEKSNLDFVQVQLEDVIRSIASMIPYPADRQIHSLVVLGYGGTEMHEDDMTDFLETTYCLPFHLPKGAELCQDYYQRVKMKTGACYSFNQRERHGVNVPEECRTYSAFIIVDILKPDLYDRYILKSAAH